MGCNSSNSAKDPKTDAAPADGATKVEGEAAPAEEGKAEESAPAEAKAEE